MARRWGDGGVASLCWAPEALLTARTGNWCCHLHGLSKIRQQRIGKRLPGRMSLNVRCDIQAVGVRLWCKKHESINPSCFLSAVQTAGVCFLARFRPRTDSWVSFSSVPLKPLSTTTISSLYRNDPLRVIGSRSSRAPLGHGGTGDLHGRAANDSAAYLRKEGQTSGERFQHLVESTPWEIKVQPVWK